jgi:release factor glutamine methyltransferase
MSVPDLQISITKALQQAKTSGIERLDAQCLLESIFNQPRSWLLAHDDVLLSSLQRTQFEACLERRARGEPLAYLLGKKEFFGLMLGVSQDVLIPRPDTETLVEWALELLANHPARLPQVIDLGTGSGAIALAIKHQCPKASVCGVDISPAALKVAEKNARLHQLKVDFFQSDWWQAVPSDARFDLIISNPPYIADDDPHLMALQHEPQSALTPKGDGMAAFHHIITGAKAHLHAGGCLLLEHGNAQADGVFALLQQHEFTAVSTRFDLSGWPRCTGGFWAIEPKL